MTGRERHSNRREFMKSTAVTGTAVLGGLTVSSGTALGYSDVSWPLEDYEYNYEETSGERYRSISEMSLDHYIAESSDGYFEHETIINSRQEANIQDGTDAYGDPIWKEGGWVNEARLNINSISDGWRLSGRENDYLEGTPKVNGGGNDPHPFFDFMVGQLLASTPGISTLVDLFDGGQALAQEVLPDEENTEWTTTYLWDYSSDTSGQLRNGESYPYTASQFFQPVEKVNYDPDGSSTRPAEAKFQTTWDHIGGAGAPTDPVAGFDIEIATPNKRFADMTQSEKDDWGVKPAEDSRFPLSGGELIATDAPANVTYLGS